MKIREQTLLRVDLLHPNDWNPNVQTDNTFNQLTEEIKEDGFDHPLAVCPCSCKLIDDNHYKIIGGEHRWKCAKVLGAEELPCIVYDEWDEIKQKVKTVRRNLLTGHLDAHKFTELVKQISTVIDEKELPNLFGFDSEKEYQRFIIQEKSERDVSFLAGLIEESKKEKYTVDSLSDIIGNIFAACSETIDQDYLIFTHKGATITMVLCNDGCKKQINQVHDFLRKSGDSMVDFVTRAFENHLKRVSA